MNLRRWFVQSAYSFLDIGEAPHKADCIFVFAGREVRKAFGIDLWRREYAPELILSVGRFEWRRFYHLGLPSDGGLRTLVEVTPPEKRHFFVRFNHDQADAAAVQRYRLGTLTEGRALVERFRDAAPLSLLVVSSAIHLRRIALVCRPLRRRGIQLTFVAVPEDPSSASSADVWRECAKYLLYKSFDILGVL